MSVSLNFGPIKADQVDQNAAVQLLKGWKGVELKYKSRGDNYEQVKALRKKLASPEIPEISRKLLMSSNHQW